MTPNTLTGFKKFNTMLLGSSTGLPNSVMSHVFSKPYTCSQLKKGLIWNSLHFALNFWMVLPLPTFQIFFTSEWFCPYLPLRSSSPLHSFSAAPFFCRHPSVQKTILSHKVKWSALFLLPSSNNMEQASRFYPSRILCQFLQIFPENLSLFENFFFSPPALGYLCVSRCVFVCVCVLVWVHTFALCVF